MAYELFAILDIFAFLKVLNVSHCIIYILIFENQNHEVLAFTFISK